MTALDKAFIDEAARLKNLDPSHSLRMTPLSTKYCHRRKPARSNF